MDDNDPITQFFPGEEDVDLYAILNLTSSASSTEIKSSYRRLALSYHPDKQPSSSTPERKSAANTKFQQVGFAYAVLSDELRRARYDSTGRTSESLFESVASGESGWEAYFEEVYQSVSRERLDEDKARYQGSEEEKSDIKQAYITTKGSLDKIMTHIPHSAFQDEPRIISTVESLIEAGELKSTSTWKRSVKDEKTREARRKASEKEAKEAEEAAKELGVWDEFYGSGKKTEKDAKRGKKGSTSKDVKGDGAEAEEDAEESVLKALIQRKAKKMDAFFDGLAAKYGAMEESQTRSKSKKNSKAKTSLGKRGLGSDEGEEGEEGEAEASSPRKRSRVGNGVQPPPDMNDEEFEALQKEMFGERGKGKGKKGESSGVGSTMGATERKGRGRKAK
ncbi:uncharacterized protein EI90DRAFT_3041511 [Cantharellus anzutake]|uniref:uncharacterized protein n=1 Tax=Cantharellus anzutake TaxID=1750568 RepID=UPI001907B6B9|nr:uncharacterized protein EI90DRAFT_3041511 [Cantharellus anzutake]KAF8338077.1 hypothetical protein EI90DRAFT_3041511 [Cantharellus anzutake]